MVPVCPPGKHSVVKGTAAEPLSPGSEQCWFSQISAHLPGYAGQGFPPVRRKDAGVGAQGRPPAQACRDGGSS